LLTVVFLLQDINTAETAIRLSQLDISPSRQRKSPTKTDPPKKDNNITYPSPFANGNRFASLEDMKKRIKGVLKRVDGIQLFSTEKSKLEGNHTQEDMLQLVQDVFFYLNDCLIYVKDCLESDTYHSQSLEVSFNTVIILPCVRY
jgi:hypothetical protein